MKLNEPEIDVEHPAFALIREQLGDGIFDGSYKGLEKGHYKKRLFENIKLLHKKHQSCVTNAQWQSIAEALDYVPSKSELDDLHLQLKDIFMEKHEIFDFEFSVKRHGNQNLKLLHAFTLFVITSGGYQINFPNFQTGFIVFWGG